MSTSGLRTVLCSVVLACTGCAVVTPPAPPPRVAAIAPAPQSGYCREFTQIVIIGGVQQQAYGVSCQQADGSWKISNDQIASRAPVMAAPSAAAAPAPQADQSYLLIPFAQASGGDNNKSQK